MMPLTAAQPALASPDAGLLVNDLHSRLNLTRVDSVVRPRSVTELRTAVLNAMAKSGPLP